MSRYVPRVPVLMTTEAIKIKTSEQAEAKTFRLSRRLSVTITAGAGGLVVEWEPDLPDRLTEKELRRYRAARAEMVAGLAKRLGGAVVVVEL